MLALLLALTLTSCIRDEALNTEADIVSCQVDGDLLIRKPVITNNEVRLYVNGWDEVTQLAPKFTLTEGATIEPESGTVRDFTTPQTYTVTSQDGQWKKNYKVSFISDDVATVYHFENMKWYEYASSWDPNTPPHKFYHIFYDTTIDGTEMTWEAETQALCSPTLPTQPNRIPQARQTEECRKMRETSDRQHRSNRSVVRSTTGRRQPVHGNI